MNPRAKVVSVAIQDPQGLSHSACLKIVGSCQSYINNLRWFSLILFIEQKGEDETCIPKLQEVNMFSMDAVIHIPKYIVKVTIRS